MKRNKPGAEQQASLLAMTKNRCFWCGAEFGSWFVHRSGKMQLAEVEWDHVVPIAVYRLWRIAPPPKAQQFVPSCKLCNRHKKDLVFKSLAEGKRLLKAAIKARGWTLVPL